jgi:hypothetical protein
LVVLKGTKRHDLPHSISAVPNRRLQKLGIGDYYIEITDNGKPFVADY